MQTAGGRRIDIVAHGTDGFEFVVENQYGKADHDHLTRGLAYAVARHARGLVVVAEEHRDEFRAVAQYLNELAEAVPERGVSVWLVEATAVRIEDSAWAPLFTAVVEPNAFTTVVEQAKRGENLGSIDDFYGQCSDDFVRAAASNVIASWAGEARKARLGPNHVVLEARGPSANGWRTVVAVYSDGRVLVPFAAYGGANSGIAIDRLTTPEFRARADELFGFRGSEKTARTAPGWLRPSVVDAVVRFCVDVADAYRQAAPATPEGADD